MVGVKKKEYVKAYESAAAEFKSLLEEQERIQARIFALRKTMNLLSGLISQEDSDFDMHASLWMRERINPTLTEDILKIVSMASGAMTTSDVRDELEKLGEILPVQSNPLATINAVLNRLVEQGKLKATTKDNRKAWERDHISAIGSGPLAHAGH
jgi:hypothetical protein